MFDQLMAMSWTLGAIIWLVLLLLALWVVLSIPALVLKRVLEAIGFRSALEWGRRQLAVRTPVAGWLRGVSLIKRQTALTERGVRVVADERMRHLKRTLKQTVDAMSRATAGLVGLGGTKGPGALANDINAMQERIEAISELGGEIDDGLLDQYKGRKSSSFNLILAVFFLVAFMAANGLLLNQFFKEQIGVRLFGVPVSLILSIVVILAEAGLGFVIAVASQKGWVFMKYLFCALVVVAAIFEAFVLGIYSYSFQLDLPLFDDYPSLRYWMSALGLIFAAAIAGTGFIIHQSKHDMDDSRAALKLQSDVRTVNRFIKELPSRWDRIRTHAQASEEAINSYIGALGNKAGSLRGAVDTVGGERQLIIDALVSARLDDWREWVDGNAADARESRFISLGIALVTVVAFVGFVWAFYSALSYGYRSISPWALLAGALLTAASFYSVGLLSLSRLQLLEKGKARAFPVRSQPWEYIVAGMSGGIAAVAVLWAAIAPHYAPGVAVGLLLLAGGAGLALLGYYLDRSASGIADASRLLVVGLLGLAGAVICILLWVIGAPLLGSGWASLILLTFLAWPSEWLFTLLSGRGKPKLDAAPSLASAA